MSLRIGYVCAAFHRAYVHGRCDICRHFPEYGRGDRVVLVAFFAHSFWLPYDNGPYFSGHPPLQFGLQALLFRLLGDTPVVENVYNLLILTTHIWLHCQYLEAAFAGLSMPPTVALRSDSGFSAEKPDT